MILMAYTSISAARGSGVGYSGVTWAAALSYCGTHRERCTPITSYNTFSETVITLCDIICETIVILCSIIYAIR